MVSFKALALTTVALAALSSAAFAADLLPPPPGVEPAPPPPFATFDNGGWYLRGDVGLGVTNSVTASTSPSPLGFAPAGSTDNWANTNLSESGLFDVGVGYQVNNWFRADVTGELRGGASFTGLEVVNAPVTGGAAAQSQYADFYRGNVSSMIVMANGYFDLGTWNGLTPYVGAGVGVAYNRFSGGTDNGANNFVTAAGTGPFNSASGGVLSNGSQTNFAWALMAGTDFNVTKNLKLELGYRYLNYGSFKTGASQCLAGSGSTGTFNVGNCSGGQSFAVKSSQLSSNDFRLGLRYYFDAPSPSPDLPLVRKY